MANGGSELKTPVDADECASVLCPKDEPRRLQHTRGPGQTLALLLLVVAFAGITWLHQSQASPAGGPFELLDASNGRLVTDRDFRGKWLLVTFGYTHCPDFCPIILDDIADTMAKLGSSADQVQPLFITVDPERDTPKVLKEYTDEFDPRIHGLTGTPDQIAVATKAYGVSYTKKGNDYSFAQPPATYLMRPDGSYERAFLSTDGPEEMTKRLRELLGEDR